MTEEERKALYDRIEELRSTGVKLFGDMSQKPATHEEMYDVLSNLHIILHALLREVKP